MGITKATNCCSVWRRPCPIWSATATPSPDGEIRLIDAFRVAKTTTPMYGYAFEGTRYDCGNKMHFLTAAIDFGLKHSQVNATGAFADFIKTRAAQL